MATTIRRGSLGGVPNSLIKTATDKQSKELSALAKREGISNKDAAMKVLQVSQNEITNYIRSKGEVPVNTFPGRVLQAALLRMEDISVISRANDLTEESALAHIEEAESEAVKTNTAEKIKILKPSSQAALNEIIDQILSEMKSKTGSDSISSSLDLIRKTTATPRSHNSPINNFTAARTVGRLYNGFDISTEFPPAPPSDNEGIITSGPSNSADDSKSIWDLITAIGSSATQVAGAVNSIGGSLNQIGGGIGASSIEQYLSANWWKIFLFVLVIIVVIIILIRASAKH